MMERETGKTMDCFVELSTPAEAAFVHSQFENRMMEGRRLRIGDRPVKVDLSSQEELMQAMFPRAKCVSWDGNNPIIDEPKEVWGGVKSTGFQGFLSSEEMVSVVKHAEAPHRVSPSRTDTVIQLIRSSHHTPSGATIGPTRE